MAVIEWTESMKIGIAEIDAQHKHLVELANQFDHQIASGKPPGEIHHFLNEFIDQILVHFATEEKHFTEYRYPGAAEHVAEHQKLALEGRELQARLIASGGVPDAAGKRLLEKWVKEHIQGLDKAYGQWAVAQGLK